jgi:hypothetical protein
VPKSLVTLPIEMSRFYRGQIGHPANTSCGNIHQNSRAGKKNDIAALCRFFAATGCADRLAPTTWKFQSM